MIRQNIISQVTKSLKRGENTEEVFEQYIYQCMFLERNPYAAIVPKGSTPYSVWNKLKDNDVISKDDICLSRTNVMDGVCYMRLTVMKITMGLL